MKTALAAFAFLAMVSVTPLAADAPPEVAPAQGWDDLPPAPADANDWPWWRGPNLNNHMPANQNPPTKWSEKENVLWRVELPGRGHGTPCIVGQRIFLGGGDAKQQKIWIQCLDRTSGKTLWQTDIYQGAFPKTHGDNSPASATVACDGQRVYLPYQTSEAICLAALDLDGKPVWNKTLGKYWSIQGYSASAVLYKSAVIVPVDGNTGNVLVATHRKTGEVVWRVNRPDGESYSSAAIADLAGRRQLVIVGGFKTRSYDPENGKLLWECDGPADRCTATAVCGENMVFATSGYPQKNLLAIRADGSGNVTASHVAWKVEKKIPYVPTPLLHEGLLYALSDQGLLRCYEAQTGKIVWEHDLKAPFYSSPVLAGGKLFAFDRRGKSYVMKAGREFELLSTNALPDGAFATPVILGGKIYVRTLKELYCLGETTGR